MPCWSDCFAGGAVVETGGGVVAHGRQLPAAVLLFRAAEREVTAPPYSSVSFPLLLFFRCFPLSSRFVFFLISYPVSRFSFLSLCFGSSLSILSVLSLSVIFFSSVCSLLPSVPSPLSSSRAGVQSLFIGALDFSSSRCVGLRVFCRANGSQELMKKEKENCLPSPVACPGEGEKGTVPLKTTLFCSLLFFFNMKRRRFI